MQRTLLILSVAIAGLAATSSAALAESRLYYCGNGQGSIEVEPQSQNVIRATIDVGSSDGYHTMTMRGGGDTSSGYQFSEGEYSIEMNGGRQDRLVYEAPDYGRIDCTWDGRGPSASSGGNNAGGNARPDNARPDDDEDVAADFPIRARSCGGIVRSRPSMDSRRITGLAEGTPITLIDDGPEMNGYTWFKIRLANGRTGYQWGGILSPARGQLDGAYYGC